jgi:hypothetical protein
VTTLQDIREQLATIVELTGLRCEPYLSDQVNTPCAQIGRLPMTPDLVFGETTQIARLYIEVLVSRAAERQAQQLLDEYLDRSGDLSIATKIEDGDNWPSALGVDYCKLISWGATTASTDNAGGDFISARIEVEVCW